MDHSVFKNSKAYNELFTSEYSQIINNIINDTDPFISNKAVFDFIDFLTTRDTITPIKETLLDFFNTPVNDILENKYYLFKGITIENIIFKQLGRVSSKLSFDKNLRDTVNTKNKDNLKNTLSLNKMLILTEDVAIPSEDYNKWVPNEFQDLVDLLDIADYKIQDYYMWSFEGILQNPLDGIQLKELPCLLALSGSDGTSLNYNKIERVVFSFNIENLDIVKKPTSFDAGICTPWRPGGKTIPHEDCRSDAQSNGMNEYIHKPINYRDINSNIFKI